jgi:hypothetical protein
MFEASMLLEVLALLLIDPEAQQFVVLRPQLPNSLAQFAGRRKIT